MALNPKIDIPIKRGGDTQTRRRQTHRNEGPVNTEADIGVALPQAKNTRSHRKPGEARKDPPLGLLEGAGHTLILDFWSLEL